MKWETDPKRPYGRGEQQQRENDTHDNGEDVAERTAETAADENLSHITQHVIAHPFSSRRVNVAVYDLQSGQRMHRQSKQRGENANLDHDDQNRGGRNSGYRRAFVG